MRHRVDAVRFERYMTKRSPGLHNSRAGREDDGMPTNGKVDGGYLRAPFSGHDGHPAELNFFQQFQAVLSVDRLERSVPHDNLLWTGLPVHPWRFTALT